MKSGRLRATVSEKGQLVIPKPLRDKLGLRAGQKVEIEEESGRLVVRKVVSQDPVDRAYGVLRSGRSVKTIMKELRGEADAIDHGD